MKINAFEGARRIALTVAAIYAVCIVGNYVDDLQSPHATANIGISVLALAGGLVGLFVFSKVVGWIVRGFAGIPQGMDKRPE